MITKELLETSITEHNAFEAMVSENKYQQDDETCIQDVKERMARAMPSDAHQSYRDLLLSNKFIPAGSILSGLGNTKFKSSLSNCYLTPIKEDSIEGIFDCQKELARTFSFRGGSGVNLNILRPAGAGVNNAAKTSTGAISFMPVFNSTALTIGQNGRRAALLLSLDIRHPDIRKFIKSKSHPEEVFVVDEYTGRVPDIAGANISVFVTDEFMEAVKLDKDWNLVFPDIEAVGIEEYNTAWDGDFDKWIEAGLPMRTYEIVSARQLLKEISESACACGDPGMIFITHAQEWTLGSYIADNLKPVGANPCVTGDTLIMTKEGQRPIAECIGQEMEVWNGHEWTLVTPRVTGENKEVLRVHFNDGNNIECTEYHRYVIRSGERLLQTSVVEASALEEGTPLEKFYYPIIKEGLSYDKELAYTQGFFSGDGWYTKTKAGVKVVKVEKTGKIADKVYCYTDPIRNKAMFNGIATANCGEQLLPMYGNCLLGAFVLPSYVTDPFTKHARFDMAQFLKDTGTAVRVMNVFSDSNIEMHPLAAQREHDIFARRIGIELTGFGDTLAMLGLKYGSNEAKMFASDVAQQKAIAEIRASLELSKEVGPCPALAEQESRTFLVKSPYLRNMFSGMMERVMKDIEKQGLANTALNTVGPCGSISIVSGNVTSGVEPVFKFAYTRKNRIDGKTYSFIHRPACEYMLQHLDEFEGLTLKQAKTRLNYVEADEIPYQDRISMQAALQEYTDSAISSTINLPGTATSNQIMDIYIAAHEAGLKGITVFREGCKQGVLNAKPEQVQCKGLPTIYEKELLDDELADRTRVSWKGAKLYLIVSKDGDNQPVEIFAKLPKEAGINNGDGMFNPAIWQERTSNWDLCCRLVSMLLRVGMPLKDVIKQLDKSTYSMLDVAGVLRRILSRYLPVRDPETEEGDVCPECKEKSYYHEGGCTVCKACGYTTCG